MSRRDPRDPLVVAAIRTPTGKGRPARNGKPGGALSGVHPVDLTAFVLRAALQRLGYDLAGTAPDVLEGALDDVLVGCVGQAGEQSFNLARNAVLAAGLPESVPAATIDRQCGSSQQALAFAAQAIRAGEGDLVVAAGVESMARVPMGSAAAGADPFGPAFARRYPEGAVPQGIAAERIAAAWDLTREALDAWAVHSHRRAAEAFASGALEGELAPVPLPDPLADAATGPATDPATDPTTVHERDEGVRPGTDAAGLAQLPPAFHDPAWEATFPEIRWRVHAGNASQLADGAAATVVASRARTEAEGWTPLARIAAQAVVGSDPRMALTGVIPATRKVLDRAGMSLNDVDLFEVNEAFAPVVLAWLAETGADPERVNVHGGAIANGHPLGASGGKLTATLAHAMRRRDVEVGLQVMCEGGGMANATVFVREAR